MRFPWNLLSFRLKKLSSFRLSSQKRCSSPWIILVALLWTLSKSSTSFLYWGLQTQMQYSSWSLTWREQKSISFTLLATLLMEPRVPLAFQAASTHYELVLCFSSHHLKSFSARLLSRSSFRSLYTYLRSPRPKSKFTLLKLIRVTRAPFLLFASVELTKMQLSAQNSSNQISIVK